MVVVLTSLGIPRGLGKHIQTFGPDVLRNFAIGIFTAELTYTGVIVTVKLSILALYWRIFGRTKSIRLPILILTTAVLSWGIAVVSSSLCQKRTVLILWVAPSYLAAMYPYQRLLGQNNSSLLPCG
jgi:hypothetical protein